MTLTFELDLDILPLDLHAEIQVCTSVRSAVRARQTHTQNDDAKTITPVADAGCNKDEEVCKKYDDVQNKGPLPTDLGFSLRRHYTRGGIP